MKLQDKNKKGIGRKPAWMLEVIPRNAETVSAKRGNWVFSNPQISG